MSFLETIKPSISMDDAVGDLSVFRWYHWLPLDAGPLGVAFVYASYGRGEMYFCGRGFNEPLAIVLTAIAVMCFLVRSIRSDNPVFKLLLALSIAFLCREIHFAGTSKGVYIALIVIGAWGWWWQEKLVAPLRVGRLKLMIIVTCAMYLLSQMIARHVFRFVPLEDELHIYFEEVVENIAHAMLILTAFSDRFRRPGEKG